MTEKKKPIGSILLKQRAITAKQLADALQNQRRGDPPLLSRLTERGILDEQDALKALSEQSGSPGIDLEQVVIRLDDLKLVPRQLADRHCLLPVLVKGNRMFVAMADPGDERVVEELELVTGTRVFPYIALKGALRRVIAEAYQRRDDGRRHFVGRKCSPETIQKAGVRPDDLPGAVSSTNVDEAPSVMMERRMRPSQASIPAYRENPVVVDDRMARAGNPAGEAAFDGPTLADLEAPSIASPMPSPVEPEAAAAGAETLLVVDGDDDYRASIASAFRERGYRVLEAAAGDVALQTVREHEPDVIVLDASLPKVHGFAVARELKTSDRYRNIRIVMLSAQHRGWRIAEDLKANYGVDGFLEKPFRIDDLVHAVEATAHVANETTSETSSQAEPYLQASVRAYKAGNLEEAIGELKRGVAADPLAYKAHFHLGLLYGKAGQLYDAIQELERAISIRPHFFPALKNLAVLYQNAGFRNKAIEMWERCLSAAPDDETREQIKRFLVAVL
jgi:DNA-binding response OmpR family regulator